MPVSRRAVTGGILAGAGDALGAFAETRLRRRQRQQDLDQQRAWDLQKMRIEALAGLSDKVAANPLLARQLLAGASANPLLEGLNLRGLQPTDDALAAQLKAKIAQVKDPLELPDVQTTAQLAGIDTAQIPPTDPQTETPLDLQAPSDTLVPQLKERFAHNNPTMEWLQRAQQERRTDLRIGQEDALRLKEREKFGEAQGTTAGANAAKNAQFPIDLQQKVTEKETLGPIDAANAGLQAGATFDAQNTPERQAAAAEATRLKAHAEQQERIAAEQAIRSSGLSPQQQAAALGLAGDFRQESTSFKTKEESFRTIMAVSQRPDVEGGAGDLSLMFAFLKMVDPGSTVREGERADAQNAASVPERVRQTYNQAVTGQGLTGPMRDDYVARAIEMYHAAADGQARVIQDYTARALQMNVDPSLVVRQMDTALHEVRPPNSQGRKRYDANGNPIQ